MSAFPVAPSPTETKLRGGYYTPPAIAAFLARWAGAAGRRLLEPSCGDGNILAALPGGRETVGIELDAAEAAAAQRRCPGKRVVTADFFEWFTPDQHGRWDGVAGNPPFIRFQNWTEPTRSLAFDVMHRTGLRPTKLTNAWVPFVVASALALRPGGRLALVVPAELMQVTYAAQLRGFLVDEFSELTAVSFKSLVFEEILQEVVLLLGVRGPGPARIKVHQVDDIDSLPTPEALASAPHAPALRHETEKWTKYFLDVDGISAVRALRAANSLPRLGDIADVDVGVVTGRNQFFVLTPSSESNRALEQYTIPLVSKSAHLRGVRFRDTDMAELVSKDAPCRLLSLSDESEVEGALATYVSEGEDAQVHTGYKCSIRKKWWVVPSVWIPDAFLLRQIHDHPRIISNDTGATSTDTIHRVRMVNGTPPAALAAASVNSATFAFSEILGRSYGGGVLELEPREAEELPFPDPAFLTEEDVETVDALVRSDDIYAALDHVDRVLLVERLHVDPDLIRRLRGVWERLRDRRLARGRNGRR